MKAVFGGVETGGTKISCMVGDNPADIRAEAHFRTSNPDETLQQVIEFFEDQSRKHNIARIGVGSFGPIDLDSSSPSYGSITSTPKQGWAFFNMVSKLREALHIPVAFDTDVNAAAFCEYHWGAGQKQDPFLYYTIGTGIGAGVIINGRPLHGLLHPEAGHVRIPHDWVSDPFPGVCPFHGDCLEGLASGISIQDRWGITPENIPAGHPAWDLEASYLAYSIVNHICTISPRRIVLGGGVMQKTFLFPMVREKVTSLLHDYIQSPMVNQRIEEYIVPPAMGVKAGVLGAIALAKMNPV